MHAGRKEEECYFQVRIERFFSFYFFFILRIEKKEKNPCNNKSWKQVFKVKNYHCLSVDYHHMRNFKNKKISCTCKSWSDKHKSYVRKLEFDEQMSLISLNLCLSLVWIKFRLFFFLLPLNLEVLITSFLFFLSDTLAQKRNTGNSNLFYFFYIFRRYFYE